MTDEPDQGSGLPEVAEQAGAIVTGLPPQAQRNFWKAAGRVLTGMAEWPAAYFEGRAAITRARFEAEAAGIRAQQRADETVLLGTAEAAARQFEADPELARRAVEHHAAEIVRGQAALEATLRVTAEELNVSPREKDAASEIEDDWLTAYLKEASTKSSEELRALFGKILAGEIRAPGSFSIRTLQSLGLLTQLVAQNFQVLCNLSIQIPGHEGKIITDPFGKAGQNALEQFGLSYTDLTRLTECDLIHPDFDEIVRVSADLYKNRAPLNYAGMTVSLAAAQDADASKLPSRIEWRGPRLTTVGKELRQIIAMEHVPEYTEKLKEWLRSQQLVMYQVTHREGGRLYGKPL